MKKILVVASDFGNKKQLVDLNMLIRKTKRNSKKQLIFAISGGPFIVAGIFTGFMSYLVNATSTESYDKKFAQDMASFAISAIAFGTSLEVVSIVNGIQKKKRVKKIIDIYNYNL